PEGERSGLRQPRLPEQGRLRRALGREAGGRHEEGSRDRERIRRRPEARRGHVGRAVGAAGAAGPGGPPPGPAPAGHGPPAMPPRAGARLISGWDYAPTPGFGVWVKQALLGTPPPDRPPSSTPARAPGDVAPPGVFEGHGDVGTVLHPGSVDYDAAKGAYVVA